jgi:predicted nucleic acid-binding protein
VNLVDTSVWVAVLRDRSGAKRAAFQAAVADAPVALSRLTECELLAGCRDQAEWRLLASYLDDQLYLPFAEESWRDAARIFFDLRRRGLTVSGPIDCAMAQIALESDAVLVHRDRDYEAIARVRPLRQRYLDL